MKIKNFEIKYLLTLQIACDLEDVSFVTVL